MSDTRRIRGAIVDIMVAAAQMSTGADLELLQRFALVTELAAVGTQINLTCRQACR